MGADAEIHRIERPKAVQKLPPQHPFGGVWRLTTLSPPAEEEESSLNARRYHGNWIKKVWEVKTYLLRNPRI